MTKKKIETQKTADTANLRIGVVMHRYLFWFESDGKDGYTFEIVAKDSNDAYDKAYESYGPQVAGMMYQVI